MLKVKGFLLKKVDPDYVQKVDPDCLQSFLFNAIILLQLYQFNLPLMVIKRRTGLVFRFVGRATK